MKKLSYLLSIFVIPCSFALNLNHSLNDYGFLDASLSTGIKAQTSSTGTGDGGTDPYNNCRTLQVSHDWTTGVCGWPGRPVKTSSTIVVKCSNIDAGVSKSCQSGSERTEYHYYEDCIRYETFRSGMIRPVTCRVSSN